MNTGNRDPELGKRPEEIATEPEAPSRKEKAFGTLSVVFFVLAAAAFLVMLYVYTDKDLTVSPYLTAFLSLAFGFGIGFGMLFRTFQRKEENVSSINYFFKIGFSVLVLLTALLTFLFSLLQIRLS